MRKVITTMLVASMILSMAMPTSAATITRKKSTSGTSSTTKVSGDYSLKMVDKTLQFIRGGKVVSSIETKDGKITLRKSSAGGISVVFTDANGKRRNITLGKQNTVKLSGTFVQVSVDKALGSSFEVEMEKGSKVTNFYAKGAAKVTLNGSVTTLNVTSSNANVAANGTVSRAYAVNKKAISGMPAGKITQTSTGTSASGSVNTTGSGSSSSSNTTVNNGSGSGSSSSSGGSGIIINGGGSNGGTNTVAAPKITQQPTSVEIEEGKSATLTIKATATGKISYQWYDAKTGKAIAGATSSSLKVSPKESTSYYCLVTNTVGSKKATIRSNTVTVTVKGQVVVVTAPVITKQPASVTVEVGNEATLEVVVEPVTGLTPKYQWYTTNNDSTTPVNTPIKDATSAIYKVTPETAGVVSYYCSIINVNADGVESQPTTSETASITATAKVDDADLKAAKAAVEALMNQEYADMTALENAIKEAAGTVVKPEINLTEDADGNVTGTVTLTKDGVETPVVIDFTATIKKQTEEDADLKAAKAAVEALMNQEYADMTALENAIKEAAGTVVKPEINLTEDADGNVTGTVTLTKDGVETPVVIDFTATIKKQAGDAQAPEFKDNLPTTALTVSLDNPVTLTVDAAVTDGGTVTYQWYRGISDNVDEGTELAGATGKSYLLNEAGDYYYWVVATNTLPNGKTAKSVSHILEVSASYPANSAQVPNIIAPLSGQTVDKDRPVTPLNATATVTDGGSLTYQWYKTSSEVASGGEEIPNATDATYTPSSATAGTSYYYCVVNNHNDAATGMKDVKATTNVAKIIVRHDVGFVAEEVAKNEAGDTSKIRLTFSEKIDNMSEFTAEDFEIKGKDHTTGETCTLKIDSIFKYISKDKIDLNISGVDKAETAEIKVLKAPEGVTMSAPAQVQITQASAPAPAPGDLIEKFEPADGEADTADTTKVRVVFKEAPTVPPIISHFAFAANGGAAIGTSPVEKVDDKTYLVPVTVNSDATTELVLTKAADTPISDPSKQPKTTIHKDTTKPTVLAAKIPADDRTQIRIECSEKLKTDSSASTGAFKLYSNAAATTEITNAISSVVYRDNYIEVNVQDPITSSLYVKFTPTVSSAEIQDTSVAGNKMDTFTKMAVAESAPETLEITKVETLPAITDDSGNVGVKEAYMSLNTVVKNSDPTDSDGAKLAKSFTVKASDGNNYTVSKVTIEKAVPRSAIKTGSVLKLEFTPLIPANVTIEVAYSPSKETGAAQLADITTGTVIEQEASAGTEDVKPIESAIKVVSARPAGLTSAPADYLNYGRYTVTSSGNNITINPTKPLFASYSSDATQDSEAREWTPILIEFNYPIDQLAYYYAPDEEWQDLENNTHLGAVDGNTMALWVNAKSGNRTIVIGPASHIQASNGGAANASTPDPNAPKQDLTINLTVNKYTGSETEDAELLTVKATEPAADGKTTLTVTPEPQAGVTYKYLASTTQKNPAVRIGYAAPADIQEIPEGGEITLGSNAQAAAAQGTYFIHVYAVKEVGNTSVVAGYGVAVVTVPAAPAPTTLNAIKTEAKADEVQDETKTDDKKDDITIGSSETAETDEKE